MYKEIEVVFNNPKSDIQLLHPSLVGMEKTAEYNNELKSYLSGMKKEANKTYILVNALTAGDYYQQNRNGDTFLEEDLKNYHKTFEKFGYFYKHHQNKDPKKASGKVVFATYNEPMKRVELIVALYNEKAKNIIGKIDRGELTSLSMGAKVPFEICSYCGNKNKSFATRCKHLKYQMNKILPDGRRIVAINPMPRFFDISAVLVPADRTSSVMRKVASYMPRNEEKRAELRKRIIGQVQAISDDPKGLIINSQPKLSDKKLKCLAKHSFDKTLSTLAVLRIVPKRNEFQRLVYLKTGNEDLNQGHTFVIDRDQPVINITSLSYDNFDPKIAEECKDIIESHSLTKPLIIKRLLEKKAVTDKSVSDNDYLRTLLSEDNLLPSASKYDPNNPPENPVNRQPSIFGRGSRFIFGGNPPAPKSPAKNPALALAGVSGLYLGYIKYLADYDPGALRGLSSAIHQNPWLLPLFIGAGSLGTIELQKKLMEKKASSTERFLKSMLVAVPTSYLYGGLQEYKVRQGKEIGPLQDISRKHPFATAITGSAGATYLLKLLKNASFNNKQMDQLYENLALDKVK